MISNLSDCRSNRSPEVSYAPANSNTLTGVSSSAVTFVLYYGLTGA